MGQRLTFHPLPPGVGDQTRKGPSGRTLLWSENRGFLTESGTTIRSVAEADGNRTRQRQDLPLTGFEDRGTHQASGRLHGGDRRLGQARANSYLRKTRP